MGGGKAPSFFLLEEKKEVIRDMRCAVEPGKGGKGRVIPTFIPAAMKKNALPQLHPKKKCSSDER